MTDQEWSGVWLSLQPLDNNEGAWGDALIQVTLDCAESEIAEYAWVEYAADDEAMTKPLAKKREWLIPAAFINALPAFDNGCSSHMSLALTEACYFVLVGGGGGALRHFSSLPSTPQAVRARNRGMVKPLRPGTDPAIGRISPSMPLGVAPAGNAGTLESHAVNRLPITPIAVFLPLRMLPIVSPSAPLTWPSGGDLPLGFIRPRRNQGSSAVGQLDPAAAPSKSVLLTWERR